MAKRIPLVFEGGEIVELRSTDTFEAGNGSFITPYTTEDRTLADRAKDVFNVKDFGAKGDGEADDTSAFQRAAAVASEKGATVYVPRGIYKVTQDVTGEFLSFGHPLIIGGGTVTRLTNLYKDYVHKRNYIGNEDIEGEKTFLGKVNFKNDTKNEGNEVHGKSSGTTLTYNGTEVHNGTETHKGNETHQGNEEHGKASGTTLTYHGMEAHDGSETHTGTESHSGTETHSGAETHSGNETHTGNVTIGTAGSSKTFIINTATEFKGSVDFSGMTDAQKAELLNDLIAGGTGDGFEVASGKLKVKTSELIPGTTTDGLVIDSSGKIKVAPSELAGTGLTGNDSTGKLSVNVSDLIPGDANDGFEVTSNKLKVKPSELIATGGGLIVGTDGKLKTDMAAIAEALSGDDEDAGVNSALMLAALGLPVNIPTDTSYTWYVNYEAANASDAPTYAQLIASSGMTNDDIPKGKKATNRASAAYMTAYGWGRNQNYPFKTISGALKFIRTHYSLSNSNSYVEVTPRTATSGADSYYGPLSTSSYQTGGGTLVLKSTDPNKKVILQAKAVSGAVGYFAQSDYHIFNFHFRFEWHGHPSQNIITLITRIVDAADNNNVYFHDCEFTLDDQTRTTTSGAGTYFTYIDDTLTGDAKEADSNKSYLGIASTRLIHASNGSTMWLYGGTFNFINSAAASVPASTGAPRGEIFYAEISAAIEFEKYNYVYTFTGSANTLFVAMRQSMIGGHGSGTETINKDNFAVYRIMNCQNASGFELNSFGSTSLWQSIAVPNNLTRPSDVFGSGAWHDGYNPYVAAGDSPVSLQQRVAALENA